MTCVDKVAALLRDRGAAYAEFDDSATDGQCWIVETTDAWYAGLAEAIVDLVEADVKAAPTDIDILAVAFRNYAQHARTGTLPGRTEPTATPNHDVATAYEHAARCVDQVRDAR